jgi:CheY-like chemotaxis protein
MQVLVLEPNALAAEMMANHLACCGLSVSWTKSTDEAEKVIASRGMPAVLVTERRLGVERGELQFGGDDYADRLARRAPDLRVLFAAGAGSFALRLAEHRCVLPKPYTPQQLLDAVRKLHPGLFPPS